MVLSALDRLRHALQELDLDECPEMARDLEKLERVVGSALRPSRLRIFAVEWTIEHTLKPKEEEEPPIPKDGWSLVLLVWALALKLLLAMTLFVGSLVVVAYAAYCVWVGVGWEGALLWLLLFYLSSVREWRVRRWALDLFAIYHILAPVFSPQTIYAL